MVNFWIVICHLLYLLLKVNAEEHQESADVLDPCHIFTSKDFLHISGQRCQLLPTSLPSENFTHLTVENTAISEITEDFGEFPSLIILEITRSKIKEIPERSLYNLTELTTLDLSQNRISFLFPCSLEGLRKLTTLILSRNKITRLENVTQGLMPSILPSLEHLDLSGNQLGVISEGDLTLFNGSSLRSLVLESCNLINIHPSSFVGVHNLKMLNVARNKLSNEDVRLVLENFLELEFLDIRAVYNASVLLPTIRDLGVKVLVMGEAENIKIVRDDMFPLMPNLKNLSIVMSNIEGVEDYAFENLPNLTSLNLKPCTFAKLPKGVLLKRLEYLDIGGKTWARPKRIYFEDYGFSQMSKLRYLDISYSFLIHLKRGTFVGLTNLRHLNLSRCGIHTIEEGTFEPMANLESIDISNNTVLVARNLLANMFPSLKSLKNLVYREGALAKMNLSQMPFRDLVKLERLDLADSTLTRVTPELFGGLQNLVHVNLQHNTIREWSEPIFSRFTSLRTLDISNNWIVTVTGSMLQDFSTLKSVDISSNPFNCSCKLVPFLDWINSTNVTVSTFYDSYSEKYLCDNPKELLNSTLYAIHRQLVKECNSSPSFTALISLAVILIVILLVVVGCYIYKLNTERKLWASEERRTFTYDAFISYSANDSDWVFNYLLPRLENNTSDLKLCVYDRDFVAGRGISECILDSIQCSRRTILVLSNHFLQSPWCKFETDLAHHTLIDEEREGLLLIKLEDLNENLVSPQLSYLLRTKIYLAWSQDPKEQDVFWKKLYKALKYEKKLAPETGAKIV